LKWQFTDRGAAWPKTYHSPFRDRPPAQYDGEGARIVHVGHASFLIQTRGRNLLIDPVWADQVGPVSFIGPRRTNTPGIAFEDLPRIDAVLITHNHYDHMDTRAVAQLWQRYRPRVITPLGNDRFLKQHGIRNVIALDWWQSFEGITLVPARHFCSRGLSDRDANLWGGFVIGGPSGHAYFAGDSGFGGHFAKIAERFPAIRLALLPIGAFLPRWFMEPMHMSPDDAVSAHELLGAQTSVPMHYGTFDLGDDGEHEPVEELRRAIAERGKPNIVILGHGEGREV